MLYVFWFFLNGVPGIFQTLIPPILKNKDYFQWSENVISVPGFDHEAIRGVFTVESKGFG
jgi:hypothetical protein